MKAHPLSGSWPAPRQPRCRRAALRHRGPVQVHSRCSEADVEGHDAARTACEASGRPCASFPAPGSARSTSRTAAASAALHPSAPAHRRRDLSHATRCDRSTVLCSPISLCLLHSSRHAFLPRPPTSRLRTLAVAPRAKSLSAPVAPCTALQLDSGPCLALARAGVQGSAGAGGLEKGGRAGWPALAGRAGESGQRVGASGCEGAGPAMATRTCGKGRQELADMRRNAV